MNKKQPICPIYKKEKFVFPDLSRKHIWVIRMTFIERPIGRRTLNIHCTKTLHKDIRIY